VSTATSVTTVAIANLGCKANQYDGTYLAALLQKNNYHLVDFKEIADIYVINTCTVTDKADYDGRNLIRRAKRRNPDAITVVTGCYAQTHPKEVAKIEGVNLVLGNAQKSSLLDHLERARRERERVHVVVDDIFKHTELETFGMSRYTEQTRAYVKIQDGCNQFCSFCVIPFARGRSRSIAISQVIEELRELSFHGFHEAILTGIHIGTYGCDRGDRLGLTDLLRAIAVERPIHRVRVSSIDPEEITEEMIEVLGSSDIFCPHLHIPLQSGDNEILRLMRRRYTREDFFSLTERIVEKIPRVCIGTDVMVGFPYEDDLRFENTFRLLREAPVHYFHVFPYSAKRGTRAAGFLGHVAPEIKKERAGRLRDLSEEKMRRFRQSFVGGEVEVILESLFATGRENASGSYEEWTGFSENYLPVVVRTAKGRGGEVVRCWVEGESGGRVVGGGFPPEPTQSFCRKDADVSY
jgi:threonylcarbamoyladenosine tRNA methylthiotransferase MtaB